MTVQRIIGDFNTNSKIKTMFNAAYGNGAKQMIQ